MMYGDVRDEVKDGEYADKRLRQRAMAVVDALDRNPGRSLPDIAVSGSSLEALYRFVNNERIQHESLLASHTERSRGRCREHGEILALHDTTQFEFSGESTRVGMGKLPSGGQGFFGHFCLAVSADGTRLPLGVLGMEVLSRTGDKKGKRSPKDSKADPKRESLRWFRLAKQVSNELEGVSEVIHVMDREADDYETLAKLDAMSGRFVIRVTHSNRSVLHEEEDGTQRPMTLYETVSNAPYQLSREVPLSRRSGEGRAPRAKAIHPTREHRLAHLTLSSTQVKVQRSQHVSSELAASLSLNVVHVLEPDPPEGETAIEWLLWTTEPIDTPESVARVVDIYRARWTIEEFFKALKTGCAFEKRQLGSLDALLNLLALLVPVAWRLLLLRSLARTKPDAPATEALTENQIAVLRALAKPKLPEHVTTADALLAVAQLGGYLRSKHPPGWITLGRGMQRLLDAEVGWLAARENTFV